jgi:hypothetical protein
LLKKLLKTPSDMQDIVYFKFSKKKKTTTIQIFIVCFQSRRKKINFFPSNTIFFLSTFAQDTALKRKRTLGKICKKHVFLFPSTAI